MAGGGGGWDAIGIALYYCLVHSTRVQPMLYTQL